MSHQDESGRVSGFLNIEETEFSGSFCRRYFILDIPNRKLAYYMDSPSILPESWKSPVGEIYLQYINKVAEARNTRPKVPYCFSVSVAGRQYFLQAESFQSMKYWIEALNGASKISVSQTEHTADKGKEWHAADLTHTGYVTEIAGGVVCKMPLQTQEESDSGSEEEEESHSALSFRLSPTSSLTRQPPTVAPQEPAAWELLPKGEGLSKLAPIKTGYAVKQGAVRKNWKRRFFMLHDAGLSYFKSEQDKQPIRTLSLTDISEARQAEGTNINRDNLLEIVTSKRVFYVQCDSPAEMHSWIQEIMALVSRSKAQKKSMQEEGGKQEPDNKTKNYSQSIWV